MLRYWLFISILLGITFLPLSVNSQTSACYPDQIDFIYYGDVTGWEYLWGSNFSQRLDYDLTVEFELRAEQPAVSGNEVTYVLVPENGTIHYWGTAADTFINSWGGVEYTYLNFDDTNNYINTPSGTLVYSLNTHSIVSLNLPLPHNINSEDPEPYAITYDATGASPTMFAYIEMPYPWDIIDDDFVLFGDLEIEESIDGPSLFLYNHVLESPSPKKFFNTPDVAQVCADGAKYASSVTFSGCNVPYQELSIRIQEAPSGQNPEEYGSLELKGTTSDGLSYYYHHPNLLTGNTESKTIHLEVVHTNTNTVIYRHPIRLFRAPVVMIHGLWASQETFQELNDYLLGTGLWRDRLLTLVDYHTTADQHFETNIPEVTNAIQQTFENIIFLENISVGRVNLVCHSMGGLLSRLYMQKYPDRDDVARLITLNTPHSGSQMANFLMFLPHIRPFHGFCW